MGDGGARWFGMCIGGPLAGKMREEFGRTFRATVQPPASTLSVGVFQPVQVQTKTVVYEARTFRASERTFMFWVPVEYSDAEAMEMLIEGYVKATRHG